MNKPSKKQSGAKSTSSVPAAKPSDHPIATAKPEKVKRSSKQARVIAMLQSPAGATIPAMIKATGWQQHSVRSFLAGVVRKRLKLKLASDKVKGNRVYKIARSDGADRQSKRRSV